MSLFLFLLNYFADSTSVTQIINTLDGQDCDELNIKPIKYAIIEILSTEDPPIEVTADKIHIICPETSNTEILLTIDTDNDETKNQLLEIMSSEEALIEAFHSESLDDS